MAQERKLRGPLIDLDDMDDQFETEFNLEMYNQSKAQDRLFHQLPDWDKTGDIELMLIRAKMEREIMDKEQRELLHNMEHNARVNRGRAEWARSAIHGLRRQFIQVNDFLKECSFKRMVAERNIGGQLDVHKQLHQAIAEARTDVLELTAFREMFVEQVREYSWYHEFMEKIVSESDAFESAEDCMLRCDALLLAQKSISESGARTLREIEEIRNFMVKTAKEAAAKAMGLVTTLQLLQRDLIRARQDCQMWEKKLEEAKKAIHINYSNKFRELDGIAQLYRLLCMGMGVMPKFHRNQVEEELDFILEEVTVRRAVLDELSRRTSHATGHGQDVPC